MMGNKTEGELMIIRASKEISIAYYFVGPERAKRVAITMLDYLKDNQIEKLNNILLYKNIPLCYQKTTNESVWQVVCE